MKKGIEALLPLTLLKWESALAELKPVIEREQSLRNALNELRKPPAPYTTNDYGFNAERSGATENWEAWSALRQEELNSQLALVLADKEELMMAAKKEFSRNEAIRLLSKSSGNHR